MGHTYGEKWDNSKIENGIREVMHKAMVSNMPTHTEIFKVTGNHSLQNAIKRNGGVRYWAKKMNLNIKSCESELGYEYENECVRQLSELGYSCELARTRYPYDVMVNGNIKVDVKCGHLYRGKTGSFYTFNIEKRMPTCDIFVCYCIDDEKIKKTYIIPSCVTSGKCQLTIGENHSKYDQYINNWGIFKGYDEFYKSLLMEG